MEIKNINQQRELPILGVLDNTIELLDHKHIEPLYQQMMGMESAA